MSTPQNQSQPGAGTPIPIETRLRMRGVIARRFAKVYLEAQRQLHIWRHDGGNEALNCHIKALRRCDRLQALERGLA